VPAETPLASSDPQTAPQGVHATNASITPRYLASLRITLLRGRDFTDVEAREKDSPPVAIIDEGLARQLFPDADALGRQIRYTQAPTDGSPKVMTIVGITNRHRQDLQDEGGPDPRLYVPLGQNYSASVFLLVRVANENPAAVLAQLPELRRQLRAIDPEIPLLQLEPFTNFFDKCISLWLVRLGAMMFAVFGGIALVLATVGVYGVKAYLVERRTREIGIRMALGAGRGSVFTLIMQQAALQTLVASFVGVALSLLIGTALSTMLYDVSASDPLVLAAAAVLLAAAALAACWLPARRAMRVDPNVALRAE
jgi:hypothetical protein